jgi:predicted alpha/beta hydrolase
VHPIDHVIEARDGWKLSVLELQPAGPPIGVAVVGHAMLVDRRTMWRPDRPTIVGTLLERGFRVLVPDQRGRAGSGPTPAEGADWSYGDLVEDTEAYVALARRLAPELPLFLVGHSLFAHTSLAYLGQHPEAPVDAHVAFVMHMWNRRWEPNWFIWIQQRFYNALAMLIVAIFGYFAARRMRMGSADESKTCFQWYDDYVKRNYWGTPQGVDYHEGLPRIRCPVLHVVSDGDRISGRPSQALRFTAALGERRQVLHLGPHCVEPALRGARPTHMGVITHAGSQPIWEWVAGWMVGRAKAIAAGSHAS